jgi:hypothetical protein
LSFSFFHVWIKEKEKALWVNQETDAYQELPSETISPLDLDIAVIGKLKTSLSVLGQSLRNTFMMNATYAGIPHRSHSLLI